MPKNDIALFRRIHQILTHTKDISDIDAPPNDQQAIVNCHTLTRAIARIFPGLQVCDGYYQRSFSHSWLLTKPTENIIDVYPVGTLTSPDGVIAPLLQDRIIAHWHYEKRQVETIQAILNLPGFTSSVNLIETRLRETLAALVSVS
jgi:hypothetical protein